MLRESAVQMHALKEVSTRTALVIALHTGLFCSNAKLERCCNYERTRRGSPHRSLVESPYTRLLRVDLGIHSRVSLENTELLLQPSLRALGHVAHLKVLENLREIDWDTKAAWYLRDTELLHKALLGAGIHHRDGGIDARRNKVQEDKGIAHAIVLVRVLVRVGHKAVVHRAIKQRLGIKRKSLNSKYVPWRSLRHLSGQRLERDVLHLGVDLHFHCSLVDLHCTPVSVCTDESPTDVSY